MRVAWEILIVHPLPVAVVETAGLAEITGIQTHSTMVAVGGGGRAPMMTGRREGAGDNLESQTHIQAEKDLRDQSIFPLNTLISKIFLSSHFPVEQTGVMMGGKRDQWFPSIYRRRCIDYIFEVWGEEEERWAVHE